MRKLTQKQVEKMIFRFNNRDVILDNDLARIYGLNINSLRKKIEEVPDNYYFVLVKLMVKKYMHLKLKDLNY